MGTRLFNFVGHDAPVYSVCPHHKENIQVKYGMIIEPSRPPVITHFCLINAKK